MPSAQASPPPSIKVAMHVRPPGADATSQVTSHATLPATLPGTLRAVLRPSRRSLATWVVAILAVAVGLLVALPTPRADTVIPVDQSSAIEKATAVPGFAVFVPEPLPSGWQPNSARFQTTKTGPELHIGYLAPDGGYVGLEEANPANSRRFVAMRSAGDVVQDLRTVDGQVWAHLGSDRKLQDSLVWYGPHSVVVVTGTTSIANLEQLAASLHVRPAS